MTFDKFYSILVPHKAVSFNTASRARKTICCVILLSFSFNTPHWSFTAALGEDCRPYHQHMDEWYNTFYFWVSMAINYILPFLCLLVMNSCIIHAIKSSVKAASKRTKPLSKIQNESKGDFSQKEVNSALGKRREFSSTLEEATETIEPRRKLGNSEKQIYIILLLVTFAFLILSTPSYAFFFYTRVVKFIPTPFTLGLFYLCQQIAHKTFFVNSSINFFLYVLSGSKFRQDVLNLFPCHRPKERTFPVSARSAVSRNLTEESLTNHIWPQNVSFLNLETS